MKQRRFQSEDGEASCTQRKVATNALVLEHWYLQLSIILNYSLEVQHKSCRRKGTMVTTAAIPHYCSTKAVLIVLFHSKLLL